MKTSSRHKAAFTPWLLAISVLLVGVFGQFTVAASATKVQVSVPRLVSLKESVRTIAATGGATVMTAKFANAVSCQLTLRKRPVPSVTFNRKVLGCATGSLRLRIKLGANRTAVRVPVLFELHLRTGSHLAVRSFEIDLAPMLAPGTVNGPVAALLSLDTPGLAASGGTATLDYAAQNAVGCTLSASPPLWSGNNPASIGCNGSYRAAIPSVTSEQHWTFTFTATASTGQTSLSTRVLTEAAPNAPTAALSLGTGSLPATGGTSLLTFAAQNAASCTLSTSPPLWPGDDPAAVSCNGSYQAAAAAALTQRQWTVVFTAVDSAGHSTSSTQTLVEQAPPLAQSSSWSGDVSVSGGAPITSSSGQWTVPSLNCAATPNGGELTWTGIGGWSTPSGASSGDLLQTGTDEECLNGVQFDFGWWEDWPSFNIERFAGLPVSPGDTMAASVFENADGSWATRIDDLTSHNSGLMITGKGWGVASDSGNVQAFAQQGSTANLTYGGASTAEWIVEDYLSGGNYVPLVNFRTVKFANLATSLPGWQLAAGEVVNLVQNDVSLATSTPNNESSFSVTYSGP